MRFTLTSIYCYDTIKDVKRWSIKTRKEENKTLHLKNRTNKFHTIFIQINYV